MWYSKTYSCAECGNPVVGYDAKQISCGNGLVVFLCPACAKKAAAGERDAAGAAAGENQGSSRGAAQATPLGRLL